MTIHDDNTEMIRQMLVMNKTLRDLRITIDAGAEVAKAVDETALAFAAFHLSESIGVYAKELSKFLRREIESNGKA